MAFPPSHRPPSQLSSVDRKPALSLDDLESQDGYILDSTMISPTAADRRDSFGNSTAPYFSPQSNFWDDDFPNSAATVPERHFNVSAHPFAEQSNNPFRVDSASFGPNSSQWAMVDCSGDSRNLVAPTAYQVSSEFDVSPSFAFPDVVSGTPAFGGLPLHSNVQPSAVFPPAAAPTPFETSPTDTKDWMSLAEEEKKHIRNESPPRSFSPFHKRDGNGIRKKTARFDIPPDRSLLNIDQLIASAENEEEVKELKQQKRLLRNRQAALDSRQRKKAHAEGLATENNVFRDRISQLEEELKFYKIQAQNQEREKERVFTELHRQLEELRLDKENLVRDHTIETSELRKKITILTERLNDSGHNGSSHLGASEFGDFPTDMGNLTMGEDWDEFTFVNDLTVDGDMIPAQNQTALVVGQRKKEATIDGEQPVASGLLLMLLLCGAFVASRSSGSSPPNIKMSDEVREASTTLLETVFKDAGVTPSQATVNNAVVKLEPGPSATPWAKTGVMSTISFGSMDCTPNVDSFSQLMAPTKEQEAEQAWSLSAKQYESVTNSDFNRPMYSSSDDDAPLTPQSSQSGGHGRNLAERLKAMHEAAKGQSAAEVYTRSLLWDRVPTDVIHEFKRMVEESNALAAANAGGGG